MIWITDDTTDIFLISKQFLNVNLEDLYYNEE